MLTNEHGSALKAGLLPCLLVSPDDGVVTDGPGGPPPPPQPAHAHLLVSVLKTLC